MKSAGKARNNGLYRHIRTFEKIVKNYFVILEKSSVFKQFSHRKIPVRQADRDRPDIYFDKVEFTLSFDLPEP